MNDQNGSRKLRDTLGLSVDGKRIFVWRGPEDTNRLTEAIAQAGITELFEADGALVWRHDGRTVGVSRNVMREIVSNLICGCRLVYLETSTEVEYPPFDFRPGADTSREPDEAILSIVMNDLVRLVAKAPSTPSRLSPQQKREVAVRLAMGEPIPRIAEAYHVDAELIRQLTR